MSYLDIQSILGQPAHSFISPVVLLLLPITITGWYRYRALRMCGEDRSRIWYGYRSLRRFIVLTMLAVWWALWDLNAGYADALKTLPSWFRLALANNPHLLFSVPLIASLLIVQFLNYSTDKTVAELRWSTIAIVPTGLVERGSRRRFHAYGGGWV